ncbi:uncharacterized protein N7459_000993 [Penicillium hispanicum]|uniref:uncharacterized protein n=1 Tax=Penicillium hispanicum TaxID=1080232 RepID=UPI002541DEDB|nr:uncharacterized protein N7459_000993 [Penicillium hispanicum]KAJ5594785.1 hypothetical protein N7459_000993 [Penicillium hispanicum]
MVNKNPTYSHIWKESVSLMDAIYNILRFYPERFNETLTMMTELSDKLEKLLHIDNFRCVTVNPFNVENVREVIKEQRIILNEDSTRAREISGIVEILARFMKKMRLVETIDKDLIRTIDELRSSEELRPQAKYSNASYERILQTPIDKLTPEELQDPVSLWTSFETLLARQIAMLRATWNTEGEVVQSLGELCRRLDRMKLMVDDGAMDGADYYPICTDFSAVCAEFRKTVEEQRKTLKDRPNMGQQVANCLECLMRLLY